MKGQSQKLLIYGNSYDTKDGTAERDFIHIQDLVTAHHDVVRFLLENKSSHVFNLGSGISQTVLETVKVFGKVTGKVIPYEYRAAKKGDIGVSSADVSKIHEATGWTANKTIVEICKEAIEL